MTREPSANNASRGGSTAVLLVGLKTVQLLWQPAWQILKKLDIELPCDPAVALWGIFSQKNDMYFVNTGPCTFYLSPPQTENSPDALSCENG